LRQVDHGERIPAGTNTGPFMDIVDFEKRIKEEVSIDFELGLRIAEINIFYFVLLRDKRTGQRAFTVMFGDRTVLHIETKPIDQ